MFLRYCQLPTNLSEWNLKYCYLMLGAISPGLENDHTSFEELQRDLFLVIWDFQHTSLWLKSPITWYFFPFIMDKSSRSSSPLNVNPWSVIPFTGTTHSPLTITPPTHFDSYSFNISAFNTKRVTVSFPFCSHLFSWALSAVHTQGGVSSFNAPVIQISLLSLHFGNYLQFLLMNKHLQFLSLSETWRLKEQSVHIASRNQTICLGMWIASMDKTNLPVAFWKLLLGKPLPLPCCTRQRD